MITIEEILNKRTPMKDKVFLNNDKMRKKTINKITEHKRKNDQK